MAIIVSGGNSKDFTPAPEGTHQGVCVDVIDLGEVETAFGLKHKVQIAWQISETMENGKPFIVSKRYTASLHEKANLRKDLESWRGKAFTENELASFDLEALIGVNCIIGVIHNTDAKGKVWANVTSVAKLMKGVPPMSVTGYVRKKDRPVEAATTADAPADDSQEHDDNIPF